MESLQKVSRELRKEFEQLIVNVRPDLWKYCLYLTQRPWDAEDLTQDTIMKAFAHMSHLYQTVNLRAYLFRMASNLWIDWCRRARFVLDSDDSHIGAIPAPEEVDRMDIRDSLQHLISLLPPQQRVVLLLVDVFEFSAREAGEILSISEGAVKAALHRARTTLRANPPSEPPKVRLTKPTLTLVDAYIKAFDDRDPDAVAALLDENAVVNIIGVTQEYGKDTIRKYSLSDWAKDPASMRATYVELDNESFIAVFAKLPGKEEGLSTIIRLKESGSVITYVEDYYFCPELLEYFADRLDMPAYTHGYFWNG